MTEYKNMKIDNIYIKLKGIYEENLLKNSMYLIMTNFSSMIIGFMFWMVATRLYSSSDVGTVSAMLSSMILISIISCVGLPMAITLYLPTDVKNANGIINSCLIVGIIVSIIFSTIFILGITIWAPKLVQVLGNLKLILMFIMATMMTTISLLMSSMFTAGKRSSFQMFKENTFGISKIFALVLLPTYGAIGIFISWSTGLIIAMVVGFFLLFKLWRYVPMPVFDPIIKNMTKFSLASYIGATLYNIPKFIFPIIIINSISAESAGYFFIAMTVASIFYGVPEATAGPFLSESSDTERFWNNVTKVIKFNMYLLIPGLLLLMIFGRFVLNVFNPIYAEHSFDTLIILAMASIPISFIIIFIMIRNVQKRLSDGIKINMVVATMSITLSVFLMRIWNIEGIAISYLIANIIVAIIIIIQIKDQLLYKR